MRRSLGELLSLLQVGGSVGVSARDYSHSELLSLARTAVQWRGRIVVRDSSALTSDERLALISHGRGHAEIA